MDGEGNKKTGEREGKSVNVSVKGKGKRTLEAV